MFERSVNDFHAVKKLACCKQNTRRSLNPPLWWRHYQDNSFNLKLILIALNNSFADLKLINQFSTKWKNT